MSKKKSCRGRINLLEEAFLKAKNHKLKINQVRKTYEDNGIDLSDKTIYEDLKSIATCDKRDNNYWILNATTKINNQKKILIHHLRLFNIYHPVILANPLDIESFNPVNNQIQLFSIYLELKPNKPLYYLEKIIYDLKSYYALKNKNLSKLLWYHSINNRHLQLIFKDKEAVVELYFLLVELSSNNVSWFTSSPITSVSLLQDQVQIVWTLSQ